MGETLAYHTEWGECAVAVYALEGDVAAAMRGTGQQELSANAARQPQHQDLSTGLTYGAWRETPVFPKIAEQGNLSIVAVRGAECFEHIGTFQKTYASYLERLPDGYFAISSGSDIALAIPSERILIVVGD